MTDPWRNTRPELNRHLANNSVREIHAIAYGVLTDADALLAVVRALQEESQKEIPIVSLPKTMNALAALPEHLKG